MFFRNRRQPPVPLVGSPSSQKSGGSSKRTELRRLSAIRTLIAANRAADDKLAPLAASLALPFFLSEPTAQTSSH